MRDCPPYDTLKLAELGLDGPPATGTPPFFTARDIPPCEMCDDIPCVVACPPTGALDHDLTNIDDATWAWPSSSTRNAA